MASRGTHVLYDGRCSRLAWEKMEAYPGLGFALEAAARDGGATPIASRVVYLPCEQSRPGSPPGGTAWVGLDESHLTIHWYTEEREVRLALDVFTCGQQADPRTILRQVLGHLPGCTGFSTVVSRFPED